MCVSRGFFPLFPLLLQPLVSVSVALLFGRREASAGLFLVFFFPWKKGSGMGGNPAGEDPSGSVVFFRGSVLRARVAAGGTAGPGPGWSEDFGGSWDSRGSGARRHRGRFPCTLYRRVLFNGGEREPLPERSRDGWAPTDRGLRRGDTNLENGASSSCVFPEFCASAAGKAAAPSGLCSRLGTGRFGLFPQRFSRSFPSFSRLR